MVLKKIATLDCIDTDIRFKDETLQTVLHFKYLGYIISG